LAPSLALLGGKPLISLDVHGQQTTLDAPENAVSKANGRIRTDNPWFTKPVQ